MPPSLYAIVYFAKKDATGIKERYVKSSAQQNRLLNGTIKLD